MNEREEKMPKEKQKKKEALATMERVFEQPPDSISFYCEMGQVFATENEIVLQFYETIPGSPNPEGKITKVRTRLRATVTLSIPHAVNIGKTLVQKTKEHKK